MPRNDGPKAATQYSDLIVPVTVTATDAGSADTRSASIGGLPADSGLSLSWNVSINTGVLSGKGNLAPGTYNVVVRVTDDDGGFADTTIVLKVLAEDAACQYTGLVYFTTASASNSQANVLLTALVTDSGDGLRGDISKAFVTFINRDTSTSLSPALPVQLVSTGDKTAGTVAYNWTVNIGTVDTAIYNVDVVVSGYYVRNNSADDTLITVAKPVPGSINGGGYLVNSSTASRSYKPDVGLKTNFGLNGKFNKTGKQ